MERIICIANQKGGVGKTTTAVNLAAALAKAGQATLLVDCDPQGNATTGLGIDKASVERSLYHTLIGQANIHDTIQATAIENLQILPARVELTGFEVEMMDNPHRDQILRAAQAFENRIPFYTDRLPAVIESADRQCHDRGRCPADSPAM